MNQPLVSIIVPCYNQVQYLEECLQSVLDQTYQDWECIIVNDGSPDNTDEVAKKWTEKDTRFKYLRKENGGLSSARNAGIEVAKGNYILPLDADDSVSKDYVSFALEILKKEDETKVVYCLAEKFGTESSIWKLSDFSLMDLSRNNMIFCSAIYRKEDWIKAGGYDTNMNKGLEDWEFWIAILKNGGKVKKLNHIGFFYRVKKTSMVKEMDSGYKHQVSEYLIRKHADFYLKINQQLYKENKDLKSKTESKKFLINKLCKKLLDFKLFK